MFRFWNRYIHPVIEVVRPSRIMEIGADSGWNTRHILTWCRTHGAHADIIDPAPRPGLHEVLAEYDAEYSYHPRKSVDVIEQLTTPDVVLVDGDHNWATVFTELNLLFSRAADTGAMPPVVFSHDVAWPYARRDMYYNPEDLDSTQRHPYAYRGMLPGVSELTEEGMNGVLANAMHEGGPRNGVLTAIEDFIASSGEVFDFFKLPFFNGLGILVPAPRRSEALRAVVDGFFTTESLLRACMAIEEDAMRLRAVLTQTEARLTRRTDALKRARALLEETRQAAAGPAARKASPE